MPNPTARRAQTAKKEANMSPIILDLFIGSQVETLGNPKIIVKVNEYD